MFGKKSKTMIELFKKKSEFDEFWESYEKFRNSALKGSKEYRNFMNGLSKLRGKEYQLNWRRAFILCVNLACPIDEQADSQRVMTEIVNILDDNMRIFSYNDDKRKRFIVLDVCIDILEIMGNGDKIHYPAALYDVLQESNAENCECNRFYGEEAGREVITRTYGALEKMGVLDQYIKNNGYDESYRAKFVERLIAFRNIPCESEGKILKKAVYVLLLIVMIMCGMYSVFTWGKGDGDNWVFLKQESKQEEESKEEYDPKEEVQDNYSESQEQIEKLKGENDKLVNLNKKFQEENEELRKELKEKIDELEKKQQKENSGETEKVDNVERSIPLVIEKQTNIYRNPQSDDENFIQGLGEGTEVEVFEIITNGGWLRVRVGEIEGYIEDPNKSWAD